MAYHTKTNGTEKLLLTVSVYLMQDARDTICALFTPQKNSVFQQNGSVIRRGGFASLLQLTAIEVFIKISSEIENGRQGNFPL